MTQGPAVEERVGFDLWFQRDGDHYGGKGWHGGRNRKPRSHFICMTGSRMGWGCREEGWWEGAVREARLKSLSDVFPTARLHLPKGSIAS